MRFDYKDPKNAKLLEAIEKEYKQCERYVKMAPLRQAKANVDRQRQREEYEKQQYYRDIEKHI